MNEIVNTLARIRADVRDAGVTLRAKGDYLHLRSPLGTSTLRLVQLYRPSSEDIRQLADRDVILAITAASSKAALAAARHNHIFLPDGGYRIVAPGVVLINDAPPAPTSEARQVRLTGKTGVIAETMLMDGQRNWSVRDLAAAARVSPALVHRAVTRLEEGGLLAPPSQGHEKGRTVSNPQALADLWSREEKTPQPFLRGYLFGTSVEGIARKIFEICPAVAVGGALAANLYKPILTQVPFPIRVWVPTDFVPGALAKVGFEQTSDGVNLELFHAKDNPWQVYRSTDGLPKVSPWRAWLEIANSEGRVEELAEGLRSELELRPGLARGYFEGTS